MKWFAEAPSNIALIKYMGKADESSNLPANTSFSYTLDDLKSFVEIESIAGDEDFWEPLAMPGAHPFQLSTAGQQRFLRHLQTLKQHFAYQGAFTVRSCNNFPASAGLASSASSFAALTKAAMRALADLTQQDELDVDTCAKLSQRGSGSSCRSFYRPFAWWDQQGCRDITDLPYSTLLHHVVVVDRQEKAVASSEAHRRVQSSPDYAARLVNANQRCDALLAALKQQNWTRCYQLVSDDFLEMHALFENCQQPFSYQTDASKRIVADIDRYWQTEQDGPLVTMDAGPNVHLLFRADQAELALAMKQKYLNDYDVI